MLPQINQNIYWLDYEGRFFSDKLIGIELLDTIKNINVYKLKVKYHRFNKTNYTKYKCSYNEIIVEECLKPENKDLFMFNKAYKYNAFTLSSNLKEILLIWKCWHKIKSN